MRPARISNRTLWRWTAAAAVLVILSTVLQACAAGAAESPIGLKRGQTAPDFTLTDVNGAQVKLSSLRGKPVMLNFWSISCPPCRYEMPEIEAAYQKYRGQAAFIGITPADSAADVREFVRARGYSWTFVADPTSEVSLAYQVMYFPTTYFIDADGKVSSAIVGGPLSRDVFEKELVRAGMRAG
ncbi:MAG: TlpA disulfide reductase family protein [Chloroflexota bacterium]